MFPNQVSAKVTIVVETIITEQSTISPNLSFVILAIDELPSGLFGPSRCRPGMDLHQADPIHEHTLGIHWQALGVQR